MIKPEDLRIGNLVSHGVSVCRVTSIFISHFRATNIVTNIDHGDSIRTNYNPIPLTEKILLDCGCKKRPEGFIGFKIFAGTYLEINISKKRTIIFLEDGSKCVDLKHNGFLHEFQNTIYSLTKTELIIKL